MKEPAALRAWARRHQGTVRTIVEKAEYSAYAISWPGRARDPTLDVLFSDTSFSATLKYRSQTGEPIEGPTFSKPLKEVDATLSDLMSIYDKYLS